MNPQHILLPTDLSVLSLRPFEHAPELFENRVVTIFNVVSTVPMPAPSAPFAPPLEDPGARERLEEARTQMKAMAEAMPQAKEVRTEVVLGYNAGKETAEWAEANGVDLIAISTHGRTGLRHLLLGSVAESILRHATVPVLVFPAKQSEIPK